MLWYQLLHPRPYRLTKFSDNIIIKVLTSLLAARNVVQIFGWGCEPATQILKLMWYDQWVRHGSIVCFSVLGRGLMRQSCNLYC
jgi:hypothetical protein